MKNQEHKLNYTVERHEIRPYSEAWFECDSLAFKSKNLFNQTMFRINKYYSETGKYIGIQTIRKQYEEEHASCYYELNTKVSQLVLMGIDRDMRSSFALIKKKKANPEKYPNDINVPRYKNKRRGRHKVPFNIQAMSVTSLREGKLKLSGTTFELPIQHEITELVKERVDGGETTTYKTKSLKEAEIIRCNDSYVVFIKHEIKENIIKEDTNYYAGIDLGVNNLAAIATNKKGQNAYLINGRPLKAINHFYNKKLAELRSALDLCTTKRGNKAIHQKINKLTRKRNNKVNDYLHKSTYILAHQLDSIGVHTVIIGKNDGWKQEVNIGKNNNQNFVQIPHSRFITMFAYKWQRLGHVCESHEESYTSKCSFLDKEEIYRHEKYKGRRIKRGLFKDSKGNLINADLNGGGNILVKANSSAFDLWSIGELLQGFVVNPVRLTPDGHPKMTKQIL